jgi:hypothetical protein
VRALARLRRGDEVGTITHVDDIYLFRTRIVCSSRPPSGFSSPFAIIVSYTPLYQYTADRRLDVLRNYY